MKVNRKLLLTTKVVWLMLKQMGQDIHRHNLKLALNRPQKIVKNQPIVCSMEVEQLLLHQDLRLVKVKHKLAESSSEFIVP